MDPKNEVRVTIELVGWNLDWVNEIMRIIYEILETA
jgi:hypothetical protein